MLHYDDDDGDSEDNTDLYISKVFLEWLDNFQFYNIQHTPPSSFIIIEYLINIKILNIMTSINLQILQN